jgi:hypothetical protein
MNRRIPLTIGAAAGGLLATAFLSTATAFAADDPADGGAGDSTGAASFPEGPGDDAFGLGGYTFDPFTGDADDPTEGFGDVNALFGAPPFLEIGGGTLGPGAGLADQSFDIYGGDDGDTLLGNIGTDENVLNLLGMTNTEFTVSDVNPADGADASDLPSEGSVYDVFNLGSGFANVYTAVPGDGDDSAATVTDTLVTPFGNYDLSDLFGDVDATAPLDPGDAFSAGLDGSDAGDMFGGLGDLFG